MVCSLGRMLGVTALPVRSEAGGVGMLARSQLSRPRHCAEPGSAHVVVQLATSGGGRLLIVEAARTDAIDALDSTSCNSSLHALIKSLTKATVLPASAEALLLSRFLKPVFEASNPAISLVVCAGHSSAAHEVSSLRLAQQAKGLRRPKASADSKQQSLVDHLQSKLERLKARRLPAQAEMQQNLIGAFSSESSLEQTLNSLQEARKQLEGEIAAAKAAAADTSIDGKAESKKSFEAEAAELRQQLADEKAEAERLLAAMQAAVRKQESKPTQQASLHSQQRPPPPPMEEGRAGVKQKLTSQIAQYERAVHSAWEDVQRAQRQAEAVGVHFERSRAHVQRSAAEHEEMETTLLEVAADLENLARNYRQNGSSAMAVPLYVSALAIFEKTLGAEHPQVASNLVNLGNAFCDQQKHAEAVPVYLRALAIDEKALGNDHPEVAMDLSNLGIAYRALGRADIAHSLFDRAHKLMSTALGPDDPKTQAVARNLATA